jgi:hypothetical protein
MNDQAAAAGPFAKASRLLEGLAGVRLTSKRAGRAAEASGAAAAGAVRERAGPISGRKMVPVPPSPLPGKLYAPIDGTGVPVTAKETAGRYGKGADGRARTREARLAVFVTQDKPGDDEYPVRDPGSSSYIATFEPASGCRPRLPAGGRQERRTRLLREQRAPHALPLVPFPWPVRRLRSGESGYKAVIGQRLKLSGLR